MKKYRIWVKVEGITEVEVEAETLDEATDRAIEEAVENQEYIDLDFFWSDFEELTEEEGEEEEP